MKKIFGFAVMGILVFSFLGSAMAEGNYRKGKYLFRKNCRSCHMENAPGSQQAKVLEPSTYTMSEWNAAFAPEKASGYPCKAKWEKATPAGIKDIHAYLYKFAKDSPTPAKCK
jgi:mono/diheme cytochrome c family protein